MIIFKLLGASLDFWTLESRHPEILESPGLGLFLPISKCRVFFSTQFLSRNLIFNPEFQNSIIPGIFQKIIWNCGVPWKFTIFLTISKYRVQGVFAIRGLEFCGFTIRGFIKPSKCLHFAINPSFLELKILQNGYFFYRNW